MPVNYDYFSLAQGNCLFYKQRERNMVASYSTYFDGLYLVLCNVLCVSKGVSNDVSVVW